MKEAAMRKITVNVTQDHIDSGEPEHECWCPLALALSGALSRDPIDESVEVFDGHVRIRTRAGGTVAVELPKAAQSFMVAYDSEGDGSPFSFELEIPECV